MWLDLADRVQENMLWGVFEEIETRVVSRLLKQGDTFFDIGANVGYYTLLAARIVGLEGRVHAFEPCPTNTAALHGSLVHNAFHNVCLNQMPVSDYTGRIVLHTVAGDSGAASCIKASSRPGQAMDVPCICLDEYIRDTKCERIALMKIDVEGSEWAVLRGMVETLRNAPPVRF